MKEPTKRVVHNGRIIYIRGDQPHRENGPSYISPAGYMSYVKDRKYHREDGPAVVWPNGARDYFENGNCVKELTP